MGNRRAEPGIPSQALWDHSVFHLWSEQAFLSPAEERGRQAACSLAQVLEVAIREELSPAQRRVLERYWFDGEKTPQIARDLGLNRSTVARTLRRAQEKLYGRLKYAVLALRGESQAQDLAQAVAAAAQVLTAGGCPENTVGERIHKLRARHALTKKQLAAALSVDEAAVSRWERDVELPDTPALIGMAQLFGVRVDEILFDGDQGVIAPARRYRCALPEQSDPGPSA